jgi:hypothetical protein
VAAGGEFRQTEVLALYLGCGRIVSKRAGLMYVSMFEVILLERVRMFLFAGIDVLKLCLIDGMKNLIQAREGRELTLYLLSWGTWMDAEDGIALLPSPGSCKDQLMNDSL